ncbi:hypothetical protein O6H91_02G139200 [Diphasiastrum complanatum]|uniref:Uncharacterized protein n=1 Tax=Diphasiastrum complanatum TaxID=34168 RepID=A0ACC2ELB4_DIPCM|nr:hypothetical protein O6H91_Y075800 [Diphasiastrum complanatum]KAJ7567256.1 hypothetical protein O6H91_02G139200 [Diphasiastrum complanatum]
MSVTGGQSPEAKATSLSLLTWHWLNKFMLIGKSKPLQFEDLYDLNVEETVQHCEQQWNKAMAEEVKLLNSDHKRLPSVLRVLFRAMGGELLNAATFKPIWLGAVLLQVYVLQGLVNLAQDKHERAPWWCGALLVLGMFVASVTQCIAHHMCISISQKVAMKVRAAVSIAVFTKMMSMRMSALVGTSGGQMLNLINNDTQKLLDATILFHFVWFGVVEMLTVTWLAVKEVGISALAGMTVIFLTHPLQTVIAKAVGRIRTKALQATDARVRLTGEILVGLRVVKFYGWTKVFLGKVNVLRSTEMRWIARSRYYLASISAFRDGILPIAILATFGMYVGLHGKILNSTKAFTVMALFGVALRSFPLAAAGLQNGGEAWIAIRRLQAFFELPNGKAFKTKEELSKISEESNRPVDVSNCTFSWKLQDEKHPEKVQFQWILKQSFEFKQSFRRSLGGSFRRSFRKPLTSRHFRSLSAEVNPESIVPNVESSHKLISDSKGPTDDAKADDSMQGSNLSSIDFHLNSGELVGVVGSTGSGKSSLLFALLGEMEFLDGSFSCTRMNVAYVPQQAWIFNDTIKNNIIFGSSYDEKRYRSVIKACALERDIAKLQDGDNSEIGERGVNLSGGQKARLSLARACYSKAQLVLMDDPLSAVDVPTAKHLMQHVFSGMLNGRAVVLVTHHTNFLDVCDRLYLIENGSCSPIEKTAKLLKTKFYLSNEENHLSPNEKDELPGGPSMHDMDAYGYNMKIEPDAEIRNQFSPGKYLYQKYHADDLGRSKKPRKKFRRAFTMKEDRATGSVKLDNHVEYLKAAGGILPFVFVMLVFIVAQAVRIMTDYWLSLWTDEAYNLRTVEYVTIYAGFGVSAFVLLLVRALLFTRFALVAAKRLHEEMAEKVFRSPQLFFDQNPVGRILNRFSKDQSLVDELLPNSAQQTLEVLMGFLASIILVCLLIRWMILMLPLLAIAFFYLTHSYLVVSRELKRLDGLSRSPIYSHFEETLRGIPSVRAYGAQTTMHIRFASLINKNNRVYILSAHASRWLAVRLDFCAAICITAVAMLVVLLRQKLAPGLTGVLLVQSFHLLSYLQLAARVGSDTENFFTSVERIQSYTKLHTEENSVSDPGTMPKDWPSQGEIEFRKYTMAYQKDLRPVLRDLSFRVNAREKVGIMGRTGAGKSTLVAALFRMVDNPACSGSILIDAIDIRDVYLDDLRKRLCIIPQDPVLFRGTIRFNVDPFEEHTDIEIWESLENVHLQDKIHSLYGAVSENGENLSVGQRQLLCLARCILRNSRVIIMDEATAALDHQTAHLVKTAASTIFKECTVLTVAHRIETVIDYDRVLVLKTGGRIAEFDSPFNLLKAAETSQESGGIFSNMIAECEPSIAFRLREAAEAAEAARSRKLEKQQQKEDNK